MKQYSEQIGQHQQPYQNEFFSRFEKELEVSMPSLGSFLVWRQDAPVYKGYFHGATPGTSFNVRSITKAVMSALAGIALQKGLLPSLDTPVLSILTEYADSLRPKSFGFDPATDDSNLANLTLKHLLTMQAGFSWEEFGSIPAVMVSSPDPVRFTLELPFEHRPGEQFNYNTGVSTIFGAALAKSIGTNLRTFVEENLLKPLGMTLVKWGTDAMGRYLGGSEMHLTPTDLMRFGQAFLHGGKVGNKQIIPADWVRESLQKHAKLDSWPVLPGANGFGYCWWRRITNGHQAYVASGSGGQLICIVPDLELVMVATCFINELNRGREEIRQLHLFMDRVIEAVK